MAAVVGALRVDLGLDSSAFTAGLEKARGSLKQVGQSMTRVGQQMSVAVTAPIAGFGALTLKTAGDFERAMNQVAAVSGASEDELSALATAAREMGAATVFSASEAADAMKFLAQAGFDADQTIAALPGTLQLAASAGIELGSAADIVSNVLSGYGMSIDELAHANDVLVATFTKTNTNLEQLGEAMAYAGPIASAAGVQFEETAAAIGLLGNAGIQASTAGTSIRGALSRILNPSKEAASTMRELGIELTDAQGRVKPLADVLEELAPHAEDAGLMMELFGQRAGPAMAALSSQGPEALRELTAALEESGGIAEKVGQAQMQGLSGAIEELSGAFEELQLAIAESGLLEAFTDVVAGAANMVRVVGDLDPKLLRAGVAIAAVAAAIGPVIIPLGLMVTALAAMSAPAIAVAAAIAGITAAAIAFSPELNAAKEAVVGFVQKVDEVLTELATTITDAFASLPDKMVQIGKDILDGLWRGLTSKFTSVKEGVAGFAGDLVSGVKDRLGIQSPSRVFAEIGENIMQGLGNGISDGFASAEQPMGQALDGLGSQISGFFKSVLIEGRDFREQLSSLLSGIAGSLLDRGISGLLGSIPGFAQGTRFAPGGTAWVGERGRELVHLPRGSQVVPNHRLPEAGTTRVLVGIDPNNGNVTAHTQRVAGSMDAQVARGLHRTNGQRLQNYQRRGTT